MDELERESAIETVAKAYAEDKLSLKQYESKVTALHLANSSQEVQALVAEFQSTAIVSVAPAKSNYVTVFSKLEQRGKLSIPERFKNFTIFGNTTLDLRETEIPSNVTLTARIIFGKTHIIAAPDTSLTWTGSSVVGTIQQSKTQNHVLAKNIEITGLVMFGKLVLENRHKGDSKFQKALRAAKKWLN